MIMPELTQEAREKRNAYMREYRAKNKEKFKEYRQKYWEKRAKEDNND